MGHAHNLSVASSALMAFIQFQEQAAAHYINQTVRPQPLFSFATFDSFLAGLGRNHVFLHNRPINRLKPIYRNLAPQTTGAKSLLSEYIYCGQQAGRDPSYAFKDIRPPSLTTYQPSSPHVGLFLFHLQTFVTQPLAMHMKENFVEPCVLRAGATTH